ncbi:hypothetical protein CQW23_04381 [Capsicum baccatum]|uniref:Uncharacterized protein n=1 Tax=Capsicum baccatum TaxID=33114 RepID=A0A2G2XEH1_CAPBA|nr:hypothetical protein CQW23_04381 [Capsicum baccatum]
MSALSENAIVIVATLGCINCTVLMRMMQRYDIKNFSDIEPVELPAVYVGGKLVGGFNEVLVSCFKGGFIPMLEEAGAYN